MMNEPSKNIHVNQKKTISNKFYPFFPFVIFDIFVRKNEIRGINNHGEN